MYKVCMMIALEKKTWHICKYILQKYIVILTVPKYLEDKCSDSDIRSLM